MLNRLEKFLEANGGSAPADDLLAEVLRGPGEDADFGRYFLRELLADDPRFLEDSNGGIWSLAEGHILEVALHDAPLVVVDLETTGQRPEEAGLTEIGAIRLSGSNEVSRFDSLVNPGRPIPPYVAQLTGITDAMVADAPNVDAVIGDFAEFADGAVLVAHNAAFDVAMLDHVSREARSRPLGLPSLCTLKLARRLFPDLQKASLDALAEEFGLEIEGERHRAMGDAEITADVLRIMMERLVENGVSKVGDMLAAQDDPDNEAMDAIRVPRAMLEGLPTGRGVYWLEDEDAQTLFVGRSERVRDDVAGYFLSMTHLSERQREMVASVARVGSRASAHELESRLVEAEEIHRRRPEYNRSDRHLPRGFFVKTVRRGGLPRVRVTSRIGRDSETYLGPLKGRTFANDACAFLGRLFDLPEPSRDDIDAADVPASFMKSYNASLDDLIETVRNGGQALKDRTARWLAEHADAPAGSAARERREHRDQATLSRLARVDRKRHWVVNCHDYVACAPAEDGLFVVIVLGGYVRVCKEVSGPEGLEAVRDMLAKWRGSKRRRVTAFQSDASTIMAHWVRRPDDEVVVTDLAPDALHESLDAALDDIGAMLGGRGTR